MKITGIIIEGVDCSGKSTLLTHLASKMSRYGWDTVDLRHRKVNQFDRYSSAYINCHQTLFDRGHFSEYVYGSLWRNGSHFSKRQYEWLNDYVKHNFLIIFAHAPEDVLKARYLERDITQEIKLNELIDVQKRFSKALSESKCEVIYYDSSKWDNLEKVACEVYDRISINDDQPNLLKLDTKVAEVKSGILLEGVNGSGKSTLAKLLKVNMVGWGIKTLDYVKTPPFRRYLQEYVNNKNTIFDRGHISEIAYGNIFRDGEHFTKAERELISKYTDQKLTVVFCDPPKETIVDRINSQTYPKHVHTSRISQIREEMLSALKNDKIDFISVDTSDAKELDTTVKKIASEFNGIPYTEMDWNSPK